MTNETELKEVTAKQETVKEENLEKIKKTNKKESIT